MLVRPEQNPGCIVIGQPVLLGGGLDQIAFDSVIFGIKRIVIAHQFDGAGRDILKSPVLGLKRDRLARFWKTRGFVEHVSAQNTPGELPGITAQKIVIGHGRVWKFFLPPRLGKATHPAHAQRVPKQVRFFGQVLIGPKRTEEHLVAIVFRGSDILGEPARVDFPRLGQNLAHQSFRVAIMHQGDNLLNKEIAGRSQCPRVFNLNTVPAGHMRELHDPIADLFRRVRRLERISFRRHIRDVCVAGRVG